MYIFFRAGYPPAEAASDKMHGVARFDVGTGKQKVLASKTPSYTNVFSQSLIAIAEQDKQVIAMTAAMPGGTGLDKFGRRFPKRCFDVGIAEQHCMTFAAGMAVEGLKPFAAIYSTFMQRAYDQIIHDVALQSLPVRMVLDRAGIFSFHLHHPCNICIVCTNQRHYLTIYSFLFIGLVGNDGATHHGTFDLAYLSCIPNVVVMAPSDENELQNMVETLYTIDDK